MRKRVVFIANTMEIARKFKTVLSGFEVDVSAGTSTRMDKLAGQGTHADLVVFELQESTESQLEDVLYLAEDYDCPLLLIVTEQVVGRMKIPGVVVYDFVMCDAGPIECAVRIRRLLGNEWEIKREDVLTVGCMTINLATYQAAIAGDFVEFTYLEYALLVFLVQHPNRTYSRESLLQNVWGVDYYGGSRTVDVHVRRIRAKVGPKLAQHLETVRGVGYLWNSH